jgi:hypothetical protein
MDIRCRYCKVFLFHGCADLEVESFFFFPSSNCKRNMLKATLEDFMQFNTFIKHINSNKRQQ